MFILRNSIVMKFLLCISTTLGSFIALSSLMYFVFISATEKWILTSAKRAVHSMESVLDYGEISNQSALKVKELPCDKAALELRRQVAIVPYVRSVNLVKNNKIYCTSLFGDANFSDEKAKYKYGKLLLIPGNIIQKNHPIIVIRSESGDAASISGIDSIYFSKLLSQQEGDNLSLFLYINDEWLTENGLFSHENPTRYLIMSQMQHSEKYPFSIYAGLNFQNKIDAFWEVDKYYVIGLLLLLAFFFTIMWWQLNKPHSFASELRRGLKNNEFVPYAQPLVDSVSRNIIGIEILMRWQHPTQGLVRPDLFIPQAEESGLIVPMTVSLFKSTAKILKKYKSHLPRNFHVGINITAQHCKGMKLLLDCQEFLAEMKSEELILVLEITERQQLENSEHILDLFTRLNKMGVLLAIDDYGTGHSSLGYLKDFKVGCLKIDMSFIKQIGNGSISEHLVDNIIDLGQRLSLVLVAEGVENEVQANLLQAKGVTYLQGYMFSKPMQLEEIMQMLD